MITHKANARQIFANNLRKERLKKNLSQEALADLAGLHRTYVGSVERGERNISIDNMERLATALGCNLTELLKEIQK
jgi:transcriptional regulator with XRE-family HTH domain